MGRWRRTTACERAALYISAELDDELSELEQAALARHLARCVTCAELRVELGGFTRLLRDSATVEPRRSVVVQERRRRFGLALRPVTASLAATVALGVVAAILTVTGTGTNGSRSALAAADGHERHLFATAKTLHGESSDIQPLVPQLPLTPFALRALR